MEIIWYVWKLVVNENYWELWRYDWLVGEWITSMVQRFPRKAKCWSTCQGIYWFYGTPKVHYGVHKYLQSDPILSHLNSPHPFASNFPMIHFNIILSCVICPFLWGLLPRFYMYLLFPLCSFVCSSLIPFPLICEEYNLCSSSLCRCLHPPVASSGTLFS
jgi:hypothetical protein